MSANSRHSHASQREEALDLLDQPRRFYFCARCTSRAMVQEAIERELDMALEGALLGRFVLLERCDLAMPIQYVRDRG